MAIDPHDLTLAQEAALRTVSQEGGNVGVTSGRARPGYVQKALLSNLIAAGLAEWGPGAKVPGFWAGQYRVGDQGTPIFITAKGALALKRADLRASYDAEFPGLVKRKKRRNPVDPVDFAYVATILVPKSKKLISVFWDRVEEGIRLVDPIDPDADAPTIRGTGSFGEDDDSVRQTGCPRSHTPGGVAQRGEGLGFALYSGLALTAAWATLLEHEEARELDLEGIRGIGGDCVSSPVGGRSHSAESWWSEQVKRGFATESEGEEDCGNQARADVCASADGDAETYLSPDDLLEACREYDEDCEEVTAIESGTVSGELCGKVRYEFCTRGKAVNVLSAEAVMKSGYVVHANARLAANYGPIWKKPAIETLKGADLSTVRSESLSRYLALLTKGGGAVKEVQRFMSFYTPEEEAALQVKESEPMREWRQNAGIACCERDKFDRASCPREAAFRVDREGWRTMYYCAPHAAKFRKRGGYSVKPIASNPVDPDELRRGIDVEMEHTDDQSVARKIALDHLREHPHYYSKLRQAGLNPKREVPPGMTVKKAKDFEFTGNYVISYAGKQATIFRDPEDRWWYRDGPEFHTERVIGFNMNEALAKMAQRMGSGANPNPRLDFLRGDCWILAVALSDVTGLPVYGLRDDDASRPHHVFAYDPTEKIGVDALGWRSVEEMRRQFQGTRLVKISKREVSALTDSYSEEEYDKAREVAESLAQR